MTQPLLTIDRLNKSYASKHVLNNLDLCLGQGERIAVVGESGSGKSTLLRIIAGLEQSDSGSVSAPSNGRCQMLFQDLGLWPNFTAIKQLLLAAKASGNSSSKSEALELLSKLGIAEIANRRPHNLSGGEARRLALARVLICKPDLILLDEAFASLDQKSRLKGIDLVQEFLSLTAAAVILVTHNEDDAVQLNMPILELSAGQLCSK
ncbi:MAG: ATP-binding cassette domain-containing protein [Planctomycetota bacterium]|nr:ATP-binding cassette domain-containing protein [Planctomycetota bacterium]